MSLTTFLVSAHYHGLCEAKILKNAGIAGRKCGTSHNEAILIMAQIVDAGSLRQPCTTEKDFKGAANIIPS